MQHQSDMSLPVKRLVWTEADLEGHQVFRGGGRVIQRSFQIIRQIKVRFGRNVVEPLN